MRASLGRPFLTNWLYDLVRFASRRLHWVCPTLARMRRRVNGMLPASAVTTAALPTAWASQKPK